jgi:hypothetical protein
VHFHDQVHVLVYENEVSYSLLLRYLGALEELCKNLAVKDKDVRRIIEKSSGDVGEDYTHIRNLRHVIAHGNGVGEIIRNPYVKFERDRNGDLYLRFSNAIEFTETIDTVANILIEHVESAT